MSIYFGNSILRSVRILRSPDPGGDGGGGGGGGGGKGGEPAPKGEPPPKGGTVTLTQEQFDSIMARLPKEPSKNEPPPKEDDGDLAKKAQLKREEDERKASEGKSLASAIKFNMGSAEWLKNNEGVLPKSIAPLFAQAEKENYANDVEKADAIKVGIVQEFFAVQEFFDLLTEDQKIALADFKKLTKNEKQARVGQFYSSIFEPTLEGVKRTKRAALVSNGLQDPNSGQKPYEEKMQKLSRKIHMRRSEK